MRERAEEMRAHLDLYSEELIDRGVAPEEARRQARIEFGNPRVKLEELDALSRVACSMACAAISGMHAAALPPTQDSRLSS